MSMSHRLFGSKQQLQQFDSYDSQRDSKRRRARFSILRPHRDLVLQKPQPLGNDWMKYSYKEDSTYTLLTWMTPEPPTQHHRKGCLLCFSWIKEYFGTLLPV
ncbi:Hypothetical predicted protein [Podarcis lilfordi]|uniref:Uncharacterized protein n=1 Tax=Podarcis lilfordi TaxID=74358 RepID=A0AA35LHL6_9SAUR|nr:Hypothetical predicted protein [Podarcis lilfordi]